MQKSTLLLLLSLFLPISILTAQNIEVVLKDGTLVKGTTGHNALVKTPDQLEVTVDKETLRYTPTMVKEFSMNGDRYISQEIELNTTNQNLQSLTNFTELEWVNKEVFLKVLVLGDVSLFSYKDSRIHYIVSKDGKFRELIRLKKSSKATLNRYVGQLNILFSDCEKLPKTDYINFNASSLKRAVIGYNECISGKSDFVEEKAPVEVSFYLVGGYRQTSYDLTGGLYNNYEISSENTGKITYGLGFDVNFLKRTKRLQLYNEVLLQSYGFEGFYRDQRTLEEQYIDYFLDVDVQYLEANSMLRYSFGREHDKLRIFITGGINFGFQLSDNSTEYSNTVLFDSQNRRERDPLGGEIKKSRIASLVGIGLRHKYGFVEVRYGFNPKLSDFPIVSNTNNLNILAAIKVL